MNDIDLILREIRSEYDRRLVRWGTQDYADGTGIDAFKSAAEDARTSTDLADASGRVTWSHLMVEGMADALEESDPIKLETELIHVGAIVVDWLVAIKRRYRHINKEDTQ